MSNVIIGYGIVMLAPLYFALQVYCLVSWRGKWRLFAMIPLVAILPVAVSCGIAYHHDSNLWPLPLIFAAPFGILFLAVLFVVRTVARRKNPASAEHPASPPTIP